MKFHVMIQQELLMLYNLTKIALCNIVNTDVIRKTQSGTTYGTKVEFIFTMKTRWLV